MPQPACSDRVKRLFVQRIIDEGIGGDIGVDLGRVGDVVVQL